MHGFSCSRCNACGGVRLRDLLAKHKLACGTCGPPVSPVSSTPMN
jgi:hypothetical protein